MPKKRVCESPILAFSATFTSESSILVYTLLLNDLQRPVFNNLAAVGLQQVFSIFADGFGYHGSF